MWHLTACKISVSLTLLNWIKDELIYRISELMVATLIQRWGWSCVAKVSCILCHRGIQLILAYSWARPAILLTGKGIGGMFLFCFFTSFLFLFCPCSSLSSPLSLLSLFCLSLGDDTKWPTRVDVSLNTNTINQFIQRYNKKSFHFCSSSKMRD